MPSAQGKRTRLLKPLLAAFCFTILQHAANAADTGKAPGANWVLIPSGLADVEGQTIYVSGGSETLTALDLESGEPRWECKEAQLPLAVIGDYVVAQTSQNKLPPNAMQIVVVDAATGKVKKRCRQIVFPEWVAVAGGLGLSFETIGAVEEGNLKLTWHAARELAVPQGKSTPEMIASAKKTTTGTVVVDLETGENSVSIDPSPSRNKLKRDLPYYDVADMRLYVTRRSEKIDGGIQLIHRMLEARDLKTGKPQWQQPIAGEVYLPVVPPPPAVSRKPNSRAPTRR